MAIGAIAFNTTGGFFNNETALSLYNKWGDEYFVPVREGGELVDAKMKSSGIAATLAPSLKIAYAINYWMKLYATTGFVYTNSDQLDGFFIPLESNDDNDVIQVSQIRISFKLRKQKYLLVENKY